MRKWVSAAAVVLALASPTTALAESPPEVYSDFAEDGVLSCGHSRSALKAVLHDASIHQYGDPLTFIGLKLAIRKQLAGGCRRRSGRTQRSLTLFTQPGNSDSPSPTTESSRPPTRSSRGKKESPSKQTEREPIEPPATAGVPTSARRDGRIVLVGVALLLLALGSGGWAARRAFSD